MTSACASKARCAESLRVLPARTTVKQASTTIVCSCRWSITPTRRSTPWTQRNRVWAERGQQCADGASEDFARALHLAPGAFVNIGNGDSAPLHNAEYNFNDDALEHGVRWYIELVRNRYPQRDATHATKRLKTGGQAGWLETR